MPQRKGVAQHVESFVYPESPRRDGPSLPGLQFPEIILDDSGGIEALPYWQDNRTGEEPSVSNRSSDLGENEISQETERLIAEETGRAEERGRAEGIEIGQAQAREAAAQYLEGEQNRLCAQAAALLESFDESRLRYLQRLEHESVRLTLAIAARVLRREAQADPLLLTGAVRVALGQLTDSTTVRLRVPVQDRGMWEESLALMPGLRLRPEVIGEEQMGLGECRLETDLGSADMGLWSQLKEIERGFFGYPGGSRNAVPHEDLLPDNSMGSRP
ncbi:FliH/SctL family protein [Acidicapsa ligni]|uniref:FliH/SctL family protein n=1 Tax=Acidicapsa ligni TaxID=542300 RepID=UPI0021E0F3A3|nr:FliH/SctL family protein [Acidicapsa ligni]